MAMFIVRAAIAAVGLWIATKIFAGLQFDSPWILLLAALLLGIVNAIVRPSGEYRGCQSYAGPLVIAVAFPPATGTV